MNKKQVIRINESQLKQIVMESVKRVLKESKGQPFQNWYLKEPYSANLKDNDELVGDEPRVVDDYGNEAGWREHFAVQDKYNHLFNEPFDYDKETMFDRIPSTHLKDTRCGARRYVKGEH